MVNKKRKVEKKRSIWLGFIPRSTKSTARSESAYAFSDVRADDSGEVFEDAFQQILAHRDEVGLFIDDVYARDVVRSGGICALNRYMDFANIEKVWDEVWNKD